mmetsp:Transcript_21381/g.20533  ORF Transcript_21381/g.20533 Transcript_21381/m.20533 type:complete len:163 (+) Transcript_21381:1872-2360(+)
MNEESFTSKHTNDYMKDLVVKYQHNFVSPEEKKDIVAWEYSPYISKKQSTNSNDTARLSFSKEDAPINLVSHISPEQIKLNANSNAFSNGSNIQSIGQLLRESHQDSQKHIGIIQTLNLAEKKKSINFSSPSMNMNKLSGKRHILGREEENFDNAKGQISLS